MNKTAPNLTTFPAANLQLSAIFLRPKAPRDLDGCFTLGTRFSKDMKHTRLVSPNRVPWLLGFHNIWSSYEYLICY
jgi:hypothetical protein